MSADDLRIVAQWALSNGPAHVFNAASRLLAGLENHDA